MVCFNTAIASNNCFIEKEDGKAVKQQDKCDIRNSPFSTFKIAISFMGFDSGILKHPQEPIVKISNEIKNSLASDETLNIQLRCYGRILFKLLKLG